jgi:hypothetical protein
MFPHHLMRLEDLELKYLEHLEDPVFLGCLD